MKYRHFPAAVLAAGLLFCTLFSGQTAYAEGKKDELTQKQTETRQEAQDEYPCESRYGMPVLGDQHDDDADQCQNCHYLYKCFHPESFCFCNILNIRK